MFKVLSKIFDLHLQVLQDTGFIFHYRGNLWCEFSGLNCIHVCSRFYDDTVKNACLIEEFANSHRKTISLHNYTFSQNETQIEQIYLSWLLV